MLTGKKILLGISGSIAAYKTPILVRLLIKAGAEVQVVATPASASFVTPLTLSTLTRKPVLTELFDEVSWSNHVALGRWADLMLIAPLSCNTLSKMANGACDNLLMAVYLSATCPVMIAPAMDEDMWHHPTTSDNLKKVEAHGCTTISVREGELASGLYGQGRMAEPEEILEEVETFFRTSDQLKDKKILITAGPTHESIDPVRFIGNHSSGKMGFALAEEAARRGAKVTLVSGPVALKPKHKAIQLFAVNSAEEMYEACQLHLDYDVAVMAAAVADYTPILVASEKIKKKDSEDHLVLQLKRTKDILAQLGSVKKEGQVLVGFALETTDEKNNALKKLRAKNADMIVLNSLKDEGSGFGHDTNAVTLLFREGKEATVSLRSKAEVAKAIVDSVITLSL